MKHGRAVALDNYSHNSAYWSDGMIPWWVIRFGALLMAVHAMATAQGTESDIRTTAASSQAAPVVQGKPTKQSPASASPLTLRGGAVPTGLTGFYDYQSNGGSPGYLYMKSGDWDRIYTTFMNSLAGGSDTEVDESRRVGYAYSSDGGVNWVSNRAIAETHLGFPSLVVTADGSPLIATHGDVGDGDQSFLYLSLVPSEISNFFLVSQLPVATASGKVAGVVWPQIVLSQDGSQAIMTGSYNNNSELKEPMSPLQVVSIDINSGDTPARWNTMTDSLSSLTSGGRSVLARSSSGKIGAAWYRIATDAADTEYGIYFAESSDNGVTWGSATPVLVGEITITDFNINGDIDTLTAGSNLDLAYLGDEPQIVFTGNMNSLLQFANVLHWSPSKNLRMVALSHQVPGLGAYGIPPDHRQSNMGSIAYPTISIGDDALHIVVAFSAVAQTLNDVGETISAISNDSFMYYRTWAVGSNDGGANWGRPVIVQDFAGDGTDSASIEYPVAAEIARMNNGNFELALTFQARRYPGMFAFTQEEQIAGPITECSQYFQSFTMTPDMFLNTSATRSRPTAFAERFAVRVVPNVTSANAIVEISLPVAGSVDVRLYSLFGEEVFATTRMGRSGFDRISLDLRDLPAGTYRCAITQRGYTTSAPLVITR